MFCGKIDPISIIYANIQSMLCDFVAPCTPSFIKNRLKPTDGSASQLTGSDGSASQLTGSASQLTGSDGSASQLTGSDGSASQLTGSEDNQAQRLTDILCQ